METSKVPVIAIDAMGGDNAPVEIIKGAVSSASSDVKLILVGDEDIITSELQKYKYPEGSIEIFNATQVITGEDVPTVAIKQKKDSSMVVGLNMIKEGKAGAFISAGNTGALLTGATFIAGRIKGIERPALAGLLPNDNKTHTLLMDCGANIDCKPNYLLQFAEIGSIYMENVIGIKNPRVGLLNVGTEEEKGNTVVKEAHGLLKNSSLNFVGNVEASMISTGIADVIVCDGFVGNIVLKHTEGLAKSIMKMVKEELMSSSVSKFGALLAKGAFRKLKKRFDYREVGGAPFLGLNALVVKAHGSSDAKAISGAINQCNIFIKNDIVNKIKDRINI
ncbi:MAG: phosphate acyltransferase PlsX [Defluviitaleaceae bacterium]|nr:phosphate acyltransferase PlsX [Defluviitaleaceae bacterium]